jgi:hypothetical protein
MLVLEANLVGFRRLGTCSTELQLPLVEPSLVLGRLFNILWCAHSMVELELLHETIVWLTERSCLAQLRKGLSRANAVMTHEICADYRCRSALARGAESRSVMLLTRPIAECRADRSRCTIGTQPARKDTSLILDTYQCTNTPPPVSSPSCMNWMHAGKCSSRFSSSKSSTSITLCVKPRNNS